MIKRFYSKQFLLFLLTSGIAAAINFTSRIIFNFWFTFSISILLAYLTGMTVAFLLGKRIVFKNGTQTTQNSIIWFIAINLIAVLQTWIVSIGLRDYLLPLLGVKLFVPEIAHALGLALPVFTSYIGHKRWSFRVSAIIKS